MKKEEIKMGVTVIDADTLLVKDEYCTFYLHRSAPERMNWKDAMAWAERQDRDLPDRWQGLTISRYWEEIRKHFGLPEFYYIWTRDASSPLYSWGVYVNGGGVGSDAKDSTYYVLAVSAFQES